MRLKRSKLKINLTLHLLCMILFSDYIFLTSCFEWPTWGAPKKDATKREDKKDDYINPWLFQTEEKEAVNVPIAESISVQNQPVAQMNNYGQQAGSGQINSQGLSQNGYNNVPQIQSQWPQIPRQAFPAQPNQQLSGNNFGPPNNHFNAPPPPQQANNVQSQDSQVKDFFMEPVNNQKPAASKGINSWLSGDYDVPEWIKNPIPKNANEPPRKTKWDIEEEDNKKMAQMIQKRGKDVPPSYNSPHNFKNNYKPMPRALDSRGNLMYAPQKEITSARRGSGYLTREEMIKEGSFKEVPKNYYEGKILPMEETKAIISYTDKKLKEQRSPNKRTNKDPPKEITGKKWLDNIMGNANRTTKSRLLSIVTELTFLLIAHYVI